jgi:hypothetical protein
MAEQTKSPLRRRRRWPFFLLAVAMVSLLLHASQYFRGREIAARQHQYAELVRAKPIAATKARRTRFYETRYFLGYSMSVSNAVADLLRRFDRLSGTLRLLDIHAESGLHGLKFALTVKVAAASAPAARRKFEVFYSGLRELPGVIQASFIGPDGAAAGDGSYLFAVSGQAEWL